MAPAAGRVHLGKIAVMRSILHKMTRHPEYRPRGYLAGQAGLIQVEDYLEDLKELMTDHKSEGES
ncbi:MAG TPA: hypothetical protein VJM51_03755 [Dehalococcoidia bacterium]|nr:hypothetical protein [Dehalococcoidia bacterium]